MIRRRPPTTRQSLVITGFMATGKTSVGKLAAEKLRRQLVDMDALIEARTGQTVRTIFETHGEDYFRSLERALCAELATREDLVIATGGGTLVDPCNRAGFANAFVVCLDASVDALLARLSGTPDRPLLVGALRPRLEQLLHTRREGYAQIQYHVDTTGKSAAEVVDEILAEFERNAR